ncbi:hypothetical protein BRD00_14025 [Halobacteriales archaeon QS_8_69_26]|nr:MAG: hypothetical protein BRD00_14025 [Halobacteriales archaeon QS_8_69_26]
MTGNQPRTRTRPARSDGQGSGDGDADQPTPDAEPDAEDGDPIDPPESEPEGSRPEAPDPPESDGDPSPRWLIRLMIALAIGIPVAIEGRTLIGLVERGLFGGGGDGSDPGTTTRGGGVGVGDDLLSSTPQSETVKDAFVSTAGGTRTFTLAVTVENAGERPYELRIGDLRTVDGPTVAGERSTGRIPAGESQSVVIRWDLPDGTDPDEVRVEGTTYEDDSPAGEVAGWVRIGPVARR